MASARGFNHVVDILLDKGTGVCAKDLNGNTPLHLAVRNDNISVINSLLFRQPQVACEQNHVIMIIELQILDINTLSLYFFTCLQNGDTPMHIACRYGYFKCVMKLMEHGATADLVNENLDTPLLVAIKEKHENVAIYLLHNEPGNLDIFNNVNSFFHNFKKK